jgi:hypothetical protein
VRLVINNTTSSSANSETLSCSKINFISGGGFVMQEEEEEEEEGIYIDTLDMDDVPNRRHTNLRLLFPSFI